MALSLRHGGCRRSYIGTAACVHSLPASLLQPRVAFGPIISSSCSERSASHCTSSPTCARGFTTEAFGVSPAARLSPAGKRACKRGSQVARVRAPRWSNGALRQWRDQLRADTLLGATSQMENRDGPGYPTHPAAFRVSRLDRSPRRVAGPVFYRSGHGTDCSLAASRTSRPRRCPHWPACGKSRNVDQRHQCSRPAHLDNRAVPQRIGTSFDHTGDRHIRDTCRLALRQIAAHPDIAGPLAIQRVLVA